MKIEKRYPIQLGAFTTAHVTLVGCGGTGSFLALHLARLAYDAKQRHNLDVQITLVDPDTVEAGNIGRQNFCPAEIGHPKAYCLMERYSAAFGLRIYARVDRYDPQRSPDSYSRNGIQLVIGAVDNAAARRDIHRAVEYSHGREWWLDCGNHEHAGQILLGNRVDVEEPQVEPLGFCSNLPAPSVQHPELLDPPPLVATEDARSCAELTAAGVQGLMINQAVASYAAAYVARLLLSRDLDTYATYLDLVTGSARSLPITNGEVTAGDTISREILT